MPSLLSLGKDSGRIRLRPLKMLSHNDMIGNDSLKNNAFISAFRQTSQVQYDCPGATTHLINRQLHSYT